MTSSVKAFLRRPPSWFLVSGLLLLHLALLWARVGFVLRNPSEYLLTPGGDGIKTYFVLLYYVQNDHGLLFTGMDYPTGDLMLYMDGFPLLAWVLKGWKSVFGLSMGGTIAALNCTVLLSSLPATPLVFALLRRCQVGRWFAAAVTLAIVLLSPQFHRLAGHLTLTLPFVVPLLWYLQIRLSEALTMGGRSRWLAAYVGSAALLGLVHPYYLMHALLLPAATAAVEAVQQWRRVPRWWARPLWLLAAGVLPVVLVRGWSSLFDHVLDRPTNPFGFLVYRANWASVFGPAVEPFASVFEYVFHTEKPIWEGYSYVGLPVALGLLLLAGRALAHLWQRRPGLVLRPVLPAPLRATVWAVVPILLFSMAWPFTLPHGEALLDHLHAIKQFRALGRFAWTFYYVAAVVAAVQYWQLYRYLRQRRAARLGQLVLGGVLVVWLMEAKYQFEFATPHTLQDNRVAYRFISDEGNYYQVLAQAGHNPDAYQAILPLPYHSIGSEKFDIGGSEISIFEGFRASLNLHRPLAMVMMARASTEHVMRQMQLFSSDLTPKSWPAHLPSTKPLLVVASRLDSLRPAESALLRRGATLLATTNRVRLYALPLTAFATTRPAREAADFAARRGQLLREGDLWRTAPGPAVVRRNFADTPAGRGFTTPGAAAWARGSQPLFEGALPGAADTTTYELSIWAYGKTTNWLPAISYRQLAPDGHEVERRDNSMKESTEISGDWVRYSLVFHLQNPANHVVVEASGEDVVMDDLLIRPRSTNVYWLDQQQHPVLNGFPLRQ